MEEELRKLDGFDLDCGKTGYYDCQYNDLNDVKITEKNITTIVSKINEIIDFVNKNN